jgi:hypothetical protein
LGCSRRPRAAGNPRWERARGTVGNRSLSAADAAFVRGTEPAALRRTAAAWNCRRGGMQPSRKRDGKPALEVGGLARAARATGRDRRIGEVWEPLGRSPSGCSRAAPNPPRFSSMQVARRVMGAPSQIAFALWGREGTAHSRRLTPPSFAAQNPLRFSSMQVARRVMGAPSKIAFGLWGREGTAHSRWLLPPSFAAQNPLRFSSMQLARRVMEAPSKIAVGLWGREGTAHFRRLTPPSFAAQNPLRFSSMLMSRRVMVAPSKIAFALWGREGTAHSRRLTPPSFAAQKPLRFSSMLMSRRVMVAPSKIAFALWGREGTAHSRRLTPPSFAAQKPHRTRVEPAAAVLIRADGAQGIWGSLPRGRGKHSWDAAAAQGRRETRDGSVRVARLGTAHFRALRAFRSRHRTRRDFHPCSWPAGSWGLPRKSLLGCGAAREPLTLGG